MGTGEVATGAPLVIVYSLFDVREMELCFILFRLRINPLP